MKFAHQKYILDNEVDKESLPEELRASIAFFDEKLEEYEDIVDDENEGEAKYVLDQLREISSEIVKEIKDYEEDQEVSEEEELMPTDPTKKGILEFLHKNGVESVSKETLKKYGYPTGFTSNLSERGEKVGPYQLTKEITDTAFKLTKI